MGNSTRGKRPARLLPRHMALAVAAALALLWAASGLPAARADSGGSLAIQTPAQPEGPIGTNVTVAAQGANPGDAYQISYTAPGGSCNSGLHKILGATARAGADGSFLVTFAWPNSAEATEVGALYPICAQDTTSSSPPLQSQQSFRVDAAGSPSVSVAPSTPGQGTPATAAFAPGGDVVVTGHTFLPGQQPLVALLLARKASGPSQLASSGGAQTLTLPDGTNTQFSANGSGEFAQHLLLPKPLTPGQYYLYVVTTDGTASTLPSLVASTQLTSASATPTPTATPITPTPVTPTPGTETPSGNAGSPGDGTGKTIAVVGLGGLSALLLVIGVIFLASAAALPRTDMPGQGGPTRR